VKYADDPVLLAKGETVLQGIINRLIGIGRCYEMETNMENIKVMRISRELSSVHMITDQKHMWNVEYVKYLGSMITNDARCTRESKSRTAGKNHSQQGEDSFHQKTGRNQ
jgi:hypothetical protein